MKTHFALLVALLLAVTLEGCASGPGAVFSFGAMMSFSLGCTPDSMLRAIAPMAGRSTTSGGCEDGGTRPVAVMAICGTEDGLITDHRIAVDIFLEENGCTGETEPMEPSWCDGVSQTPCTCVSYQGCEAGYPVHACEYNAPHQLAPNMGPVWDFFAQF